MTSRKNVFYCIIITIILYLSYSCSNILSQADPEKVEVVFPVNIQIDFVDGEYSSNTKAYVIWADNESFIQNMFVCQKVNNNELTGTVLPYWAMNIRTNSNTAEVDAVAGATQKHTDFSVPATITEKQTAFTLFFEIDHSFDENDWFADDQPAILYSADIDLTNAINEYTLQFVGWTPNGSTANIIPSTPAGTLQRETRYITNLNDGGNFGALDSRTATDMVGTIKVKILR